MSYGRFSTGMRYARKGVKLEAAKKHPKKTWGHLAYWLHLLIAGKPLLGAS